MTITIRLASAPMLNTPNLVRFLQSKYWEKSARKRLRAVILEGYGDNTPQSPTEKEVHGLLSGEIPFVIEDNGQTVAFNVTRKEVLA